MNHTTVPFPRRLARLRSAAPSPAALRLAAAIASLLPVAAFAANLEISTPTTLASGSSGYDTIFFYASTLNQTGGDLSAGTMYLGMNGNTASYTLAGGTATFGSVRIAEHFFSNTANTQASLVVTGGTLTTGSLLLAPLSGYFETARVFQSGGLVDADTVRIATGVGHSARYYLGGGVLATNGITTGTNSDRMLHFGGGMLRATAHNDNFLHSAITAMVAANGARIDTNGFDIGYHGTLVPDPDSAGGGLIKSGAGTLSLYGANTHTGPTLVQSGTLSFGWLPSLGAASSVLTINGGTLRVTGTSVTDLGSRLLDTATFDGGIDIADVANTFTLPHSFSGSGALVKSGAGTLVLSGSSTRSGATTVNAGTLRLTHPLALQKSILTLVSGGTLDRSSLTSATFGGLGGSVDFPLQTGASPFALTLEVSGAPTFSGVLSGTGSLTKSGSGTQTLAGANTYSGGTTLSAGTLAISSLSNLGSGPVNFTGGNLRVNGTALADFDAVSLNASSFNGGIEVANAAHTVALNQALSGPGSLRKAGPGTLVLGGANTLAGGITLAGGTLSVSSAGQLGSATNPLAFQGGILRVTGTALQTLGSRPINVTDFNGGFDIADAANTFTLSQALSGTGHLTKTGPGTLVLSPANTQTGSLTVTGGLVEFASSNAFGNTNNKITLDGGGLRWSGHNSSVANRLNPLGAGGSVFDTNGNNVAFGAGISGAGGVTKTGAGTLTYAATNTYTGGTTVNGGTLELATGGPTGAIRGALTINSGATVLTSAVNALGWQGGVKVNTLAINGGTLNHTAAGSHGFGIAYALDGATMNSNGGVSNAAATSHFAVDGASSFHVTGSTPSTISGRLDLRGDGGFTDVNFTVAAGSRLNVTAGISSQSGATLPGPVGIIKSGPGVLALTGANTYSGNTTVNDGLVEFNSASALGASSNKITLNGGGLRWATGTAADISGRLNPLGAGGGTLDTNGNNVVLAAALAGSGALVKNGAGTLRSTAANTYTGGTTVNGGTLELGGASPANGDGLIRGTLTINPGATVRATATNALGYSANRVTALYVNGGTFSTAAGTSDQGWAIGYVLDGGTLSSNDGVSSSSASSKFAMGNHSAVFVNGNSASTIAGRVDLRGDFNTNTDFTVAANATLNVTAAITSSIPATGAPGFTKKGDGLMILAGANTYTGPTFVSAGSLRVNGSANNSAFTVQSGATLGGAGSVGPTTIRSGATLAPGNSPGLLTVNGDLTLDSGSFTALEIAGLSRGAADGYDAIDVSGLFTAGGTLSVSFTSGYTPSGPATFDFFNFTSFGGSFAQVNLPVVGGYTWNTSQLSIDGTVSLVASAIPEPSSFAALAGLAGAGFAATRRRRRAPSSM